MSLIGEGTKHGLGAKMPRTYHMPYADCYRRPFKLEYPTGAPDDDDDPDGLPKGFALASAPLELSPDTGKRW